MIRNTVLALTAAAAMGIALAPAAEAKNHLNINVGLGFGGYHHGHGWGYGGYYDGWYGDDCHYITVKHKKWNKWHTKKKVYFTKELVCY